MSDLPHLSTNRENQLRRLARPLTPSRISSECVKPRPQPLSWQPPNTMRPPDYCHCSNGHRPLPLYSTASATTTRMIHARTEVTRRLATAYLAEEQPLQAAREFERIGNSHEDPTLRREALWQAAELYATAGQPNEAVMTYQRYIQQFPQPVEPAVEARQRIASHYAASNNLTELQRWLTDIIKADRQAGVQRSDRTRYLAARAQLTLADHAHENYRRVSPGPATGEKPCRQETPDAIGHAAIRTGGRLPDCGSHHGRHLPNSADLRGTGQLHYCNHNGRQISTARPWSSTTSCWKSRPIRLKSRPSHCMKPMCNASSPVSYNAWIEKSLQQLAQLVPAQYAKLERGASYVSALH